MNTFRIIKHFALGATFLAMCSAPAVVNAQQAGQAQQTPQSDPGQQPPRAEQGQNHQGEMANLSLSDDQKAQLQKIHQSAKSQMDGVKNDSTLTPDQKRAKMHEIHKSAHEQIAAMLTPEQRQQWKSDEAAHKAAKQQAAPPQQ
jgi:Spy/CpxP family protein refolding chaperone